jgi:hypothetical protein
MALNMNATLESVMALFEEVGRKQEETARMQKETSAQINAQINAQIKETDKLIKERRESQKETDKQIKEMGKRMDELSKNVGGVNGSFGDIAEGLMASDLCEKFAALGLDFEHTIQNYWVKDKKTGRSLAEVDILLVNGTIAMVVEAKTKMTRGDVDEHEERMAILRQASHSLFGKRKLYGAMAGVKMSSQARKYAIEKGFYLIALTGSTIKIDVPDGFNTKTW